jgi:acetate kinase
MVLTINGGSSSLKYAFFEPGDPPKRVVSGKFERIGSPELPDHGTCVPNLLQALGTAKVEAVAHRIVHGGPRYFDPAPVSADMLDELRRLQDFVPEHLPAEIQLIEILTGIFSAVPHILCFDTGFHRDMPRVAQLLPIPRKYAEHGIRRYGFHGLSYTWLMHELTRIGGEGEARGRVILAHLGNGCSMAAVRDGKCIETTMGFTPAAGMVMSRRSGDLDPGLVAYLARVEGVTPDEFNRIINTKSGSFGISETTSDVRDLLALESSDERAAEALAVFCYHARKWIGALTAACGGLDTLVFAGGIGENAPAIRDRICSGLDFLGVSLDAEANNANRPVISAAGSRLKVRVIPTDEELYMASCAFQVISSVT